MSEVNWYVNNCHEAELATLKRPQRIKDSDKHRKSICDSFKNELFLITAMRRIWILTDCLSTNIETLIREGTLQEFHMKKRIEK